MNNLKISFKILYFMYIFSLCNWHRKYLLHKIQITIINKSNYENWHKTVSSTTDNNAESDPTPKFNYTFTKENLIGKL